MDQKDKTTIDIQTKALNVLKLNDKGSYTVPNNELYPHQWLWDSCFIAIGLSHQDTHRAELEILSLLKGQWSNGMLPSIILRKNKHFNQTSLEHHEKIWRSFLNPNAPANLPTSGITQPPMLAEAITRVGKQMNKYDRRRWYKQVYKPLVDYHSWLYKERDPHGEGLVLLIHPWECGMDNTPPWMSELNDHLLPSWIRTLRFMHLDKVIGWFRSDHHYAGLNQRLSNVEALAFYDVERRLRRKNYDFNRVIDHSLFAIEDLMFNCILIRANQLLKEMAEYIDESLPAELLESMAKAEKQLNKLWDEYSEEYFSRDFVSHRLITESSVAAFLPLYAGCIKRDRAARIVLALENEHRFGTAFAVPSAPLDSQWFNPKRYWQGPAWVNTNWLIIDGLRRYGYNDHADALKETTIDMVRSSGFYEYFNPDSGAGLGTDNYSWTAALCLDLINS